MNIKVYTDYFKEFNSWFGTNLSLPKEYEGELIRITDMLGFSSVFEKEKRFSKLIESINKKFDLNKKEVKKFIDFSAKQKVYFNYHDKKRVSKFYNTSNKKGFIKFINELDLLKEKKKEFIKLFKPLTDKEVIDFIKNELKISNKKEDIILSIFTAYVFHSFPVKKIHNCFNELSEEGDLYIENFQSFLKHNYGHKFERNVGLSICKIDNELYEKYNGYEDFINGIYELIESKFSLLANHCYLSIIIEPIHYGNRSITWDIYRDVTLFSEKFKEEKLKKGYFHPEKIKTETLNYIKEIDINNANFEVANSGFTYKDCIITFNSKLEKNKGCYNNEYSILTLFEKNERDEELVPCPACRSKNVRGNSYPTLGVKSWECNNLFCFDKSKYNRGKRYSLASLIKQEAINDELNLILNGTIRKFGLDVVDEVDDELLLTFLVKHYSLYNDNVEIMNFDNFDESNLSGRNIKIDKRIYKGKNNYKYFYNSSFFKRFIVESEEKKIETFSNISTIPDVYVYNGNSTIVLKQFLNNSIDAAVTSPPYYNARSYSQWANIYCYLFDMYNNAREVYRVLKPGATYLYNIFDYFDNENNIVYSAMGKKRLILGAYIMKMFKEIGFDLIDNIIWDKGHIQGNRSNNQGNNSPYYQAPLNCYEHIIYFRKPGDEVSELDLPKILKLHPVVKMIKGENILGHTAPFPKEIPKLITKQLIPGSTILDPYSGSFTTARQAKTDGIKSVNIEMSEEYCNLGLRLINKEISDKSLTIFD
jgi:DNA modification methylase